MSQAAHRYAEAFFELAQEMNQVDAWKQQMDQVAGVPVNSVYSISDLPDYESYNYKDCPMCKAGRKLDALVNSFGYSSV